MSSKATRISVVALRKESVDRNQYLSGVMEFGPSLSARRAWIEMIFARLKSIGTAVALRKESVDRNQRKMWGRVR